MELIWTIWMEENQVANKQYIYKLAYTDNYHVIQVVDGKIEHSTIVAYYELDGFLSALRSMGMRKAIMCLNTNWRCSKRRKNWNLPREHTTKRCSTPSILRMVKLKPIG